MFFVSLYCLNNGQSGGASMIAAGGTLGGTSKILPPNGPKIGEISRKHLSIARCACVGIVDASIMNATYFRSILE